MKTITQFVALILMTILSFTAVSQTNKISQEIIRSDFGYILYDENKIPYEVDTTSITVKFIDESNLRKAYNVIRTNILGYADILAKKEESFIDFISTIEFDVNISEILYNTFGSYNTNDLHFQNQWGIFASNVDKAWKIEMGNSDIVVAVLDSGVDWENNDLGMGNDNYQNIYLNADEDTWANHSNPNTGNGLDDDNNGFVDDWKGWNFYLNTNDCRTSAYHGTFVAGIISSKINNNYGIAGVAGGNNTEGVKILPYCIGINIPHSSVLDDAILSAVDNGANIIQLSLNINKTSDIEAAINYAIGHNVIIVCSSGNHNIENNNYNVLYPANNKNVISVGAIEDNLMRASFSRYGSELSLVAPGVGIYSDSLDNIIVAKNGTSFAAPHVSGVAALILSVNPNLTSQQVRDIIEQTAQKVGGYTYSNNPTLHPNGSWNNEMGYGLVDAYKAVSLALAMACNTDNSILLNGEITSNTTISASTIGYGEIIVKSGVTLTVSSNLKMVKASKIIVEPGAKLIVNGGEIIGACGEYWDGIRLEGNKNLSQTETNQGVVELNNALISDARDAISVIGENSDWNKTGGIIKATNTTFKNNRRSIEFMSYGEGSNVNNVSYFRNCTFTWDDDLLANESTVQSHITMYQVKGVDFKGCTFKDERTSTTGLTTHGILTNQAGYIVNNYLLLPGHGGTAVYKNTSFENLTYGIRTEEADDKLCKVENSVFDENDKGIYVTNTDNLYVVNNTFNVKSMAHGMGLAAQNSTNFTIQKNDFLGTSNTNNLLATAGLQIVSSGEDDNLIKQNRFVNLYSGFQALGVNYGINTGLELNCNSFSSCQRGIDIPAFPLNNVTGIKSIQGSQSLSAGNKFTNNTNNVINNGVNTITYYYYGSIENPNYISMKFLPMQASSGASCGLIGNITEPNFPLLSNGDGEENEEEESIETLSIAPTTVLSYINKKDYLSAESLLSASDMSQEEKNDYRLYSSYIQEYGNSYNIPTNILLDLSEKEGNIGLVAKQMLYFKGVKTDFHPKVIVEQTQDSDTTTINNKMKSVKVLNGLSQNDEYTLSPNPANSEVVVKGAKGISEIIILDLQGKELKSFYNTEKFNISFLKNGTYIVRILDSENKVHYQKLIKQ